MTAPTTVANGEAAPVTILVIEDNPLLAAGIRSNLEYEGYEVTLAGTGREGLRLAKDRAYSLILLDLMLPDIDGFRVLRDARDAGVYTPVLVLTALGDEADKVRGFRFGADDYVTKPFGLMELMARVAALIRRSRSAPVRPSTSVVRFGAVEVDCATRTVVRDGEPVSLRPKEFDLLLALIRREERVVSREALLREVWGYGDDVQSRTVDTHMAELRRKLEPDPTSPRHLLTVRKAGYRLSLAAP